MAAQRQKESLFSFIEAYKKHENLWNRDHVDYFNKFKREKSEQSISNEMKDIYPNMTVADVKRKFRSIRSQYCRDLKYRTPRSSFFEKLEFLKPHVVAKTKTSKNGVSNLNESSMEGEDDGNVVKRTSRGTARRNKKGSQVAARGMQWPKPLAEKLIELFKQSSSLYNVNDPKYRDAESREISLANICSKLKKFNDKITVNDIKSKIHLTRTRYVQALRKVEMEKQQGNNDYTHTWWAFKKLSFLKPYYVKTTNSVISHVSRRLSEISEYTDEDENATNEYTMYDDFIEEFSESDVEQDSSSKAIQSQLDEDIDDLPSEKSKMLPTNFEETQCNISQDIKLEQDEDETHDIEQNEHMLPSPEEKETVFKELESFIQIKPKINNKPKEKINDKPMAKNNDKIVEDTLKHPANKRTRKIEVNKKLLNIPFKKEDTGYDWLGRQVAFEINSIKDENIRSAAVKKIQKVLHEAYEQVKINNCSDPLSTSPPNKKRRKI
ncbi:uncharacterized protein isoform X2 [Musca autumnalis]|uniref:uncharacterized protein isoform X2 n=1 Tax=Musca autumnalis TaxID=221902 RepID=UPI003CEF8443